MTEILIPDKPEAACLPYEADKAYVIVFLPSFPIQGWLALVNMILRATAFVVKKEGWFLLQKILLNTLLTPHLNLNFFLLT